MKLRKAYKKAIKEWGGQSFRPELPGPENIHKFPFHGQFTRQGGKPVNTPMEQKQDPKSDIEIGELAADEADKEIQKLPEELSLSELFKFTVSGLDNTSQGVHTMGGGFPAKGKGLTDFQSFDPDYKTSKNKKRFQTLKGRAAQRPKTVPRLGKTLPVDELVQAGKADVNDDIDESLNEMNYRDAGLPGGIKTTKQPFASGIPGYDKKDIARGYEKVDELVKINKKEEERLKELEEEKLKEASASSSYNRLQGQKIMHSPKSDLNFWEIINHENVYIMGKEQVNNEKSKKRKKRISKRNKK